MRSLTRFKYYLFRIKEAGWSATTRKIFSKIAPYLWWPVYAAGKFGLLHQNLRKIELSRIQNLGSTLSCSIKNQVDIKPLYLNESRRRVLFVLSGNWSVLGFGSTKIPSGLGWMSDPFHGYTWESKYFSFVDYVCHDQACDVKVAWELSRLQFLPWLAEGACLNNDLSNACQDQFVRIIRNWIESNPPGYGVNWTCAMEVAIRAINILVSFALFSTKLEDDICELIRSSLEEHFIFLNRFPETSDVTGNHYLCDLMGMVAVASLFEGEDDFNYLAKCFIDECNAQFELDGVHLEHAPVYHRLCMDVMVLGGAFIHARNRQMTAPLIPVFTRALNFAKSIADIRGWVPIFGDADGGMILNMQSEARDISDLCSLGSGNDSKALNVWIKGIANDSQYLRTHSREVIEHNPCGGFIGIQVKSATISMRVGHQGLLGRAPHDHDDALSIWVVFAGRDFIVDRGCYSYTLNSSRRKHDIVSSSHNLLKAVDCERYSGREGSIHLTMRGAPVCSDAYVSQGVNYSEIVANIDSIEKIGPVSRIVRVIDGDNLSFDVIDSCECDVRLVLAWHFAPGLNIRPINASQFEIRGSTVIGSLEFIGPQYEGYKIFQYSFAPNYGENITCFGIQAFIGGFGAREIHSKFEASQVIN